MAANLLTPKEAAARLRCSQKQLARLRAAGALKYVQVGLTERRPRWLVAESDLEEFITRQSRRDVPPSPPTPTRRARRFVDSDVAAFAARLSERAAKKPSR